MTGQSPIRNEEILFDDEPGFPHPKFGKGVFINNWLYGAPRQSPWYLHEIPSYAKAPEGYPPVAKSAEAQVY